MKRARSTRRNKQNARAVHARTIVVMSSYPAPDDRRGRRLYATGNLTKEIFADDCRFTDPTNDVVGLSRYLTALGLLFDPATSSVDLFNIAVTGPHTIEADWSLQGYLRFPWKPRVEPYNGHTVYTVGEESGVIESQFQTWSISGAKALAESFTPTTGAVEN